MNVWFETLQAWGEGIFFAFWLPTLIWSILAAILHLYLSKLSNLATLYLHRRIIWWALPLGFLWANWGWLPSLQSFTKDSSLKATVFLTGFTFESQAAALEQSFLWRWQAIYLLLAVLTFSLALGRLAYGFKLGLAGLRLKQLHRCLHPLAQTKASSRFWAELDQEATGLKINRSIEVYHLSLERPPFTFGLLRPKLVLPPSLWSESPERTLAIRHELIHIRRYDVLWRCLEEIVVMIWGWHPLVKRYQSELSFLREATCDAEVLKTSGTSKQTYAVLLYELLASESDPFNPLLSGMAAGHPQQLKRRIQTMRTNQSPLTLYGRWIGGLLLGAVLGLTAASGVFSRQPTVATPPKPLQNTEDLVQPIFPERLSIQIGLKTPADTSRNKTIMIGGKLKTLKNIRVYEQGNHPIEVLFTDGTKQRYTADEATDLGIKLPPPPPPPPFQPARKGTPPPPPPPPPTGKWTEVKPPSGNPDDIYNFTEKRPEFSGGADAFQAYLRDNIKYPSTAKADKAQGLVFVSFVVGTQGEILDAQVVKGLHPDCDAEALRVVNAMPKWIPGEDKGKPVKVRYTVQVHFKL